MDSKDKYENFTLEIIDELISIYNTSGNIIVQGYYKFLNSRKIYYDFQIIDSTKLKGSYDKLELLELIYFLENL